MKKGKGTGRLQFGAKYSLVLRSIQKSFKYLIVHFANKFIFQTKKMNCSMPPKLLSCSRVGAVSAVSSVKIVDFRDLCGVPGLLSLFPR